MIILRTVSRIAFPFIALFGWYVAVHGHLTPGGGFPAGAIIASAFLLIYLAKFPENGKKKLASATMLESGGLLAILGIAAAVLVFLLVTPESLALVPGRVLSALPILGLNIATALEVTAGLVIIVVSFLAWEELGEGSE